MKPLHNRTFAKSASSAIRNVRADDSILWEPGPDERIMILVPHPDDEVLAAGGVIAGALKSGGQCKVRVIIATNGDASYTTVFWHGSHLNTRKNFQRQSVLRQRESLNALLLLGLHLEQVHFWGFPDRGLAALWKNHWNARPPYRSSTTGYDRSVQALNSPILPFRGASLDELFRRELLDFRPTLVIMPHPADHHSDHSALAGFTLRAVRQYHIEAHFQPPEFFAYWIWRETKPWLMGVPVSNRAHFQFGENWAPDGNRHFVLSPDIQEQKARALRCYPSQRIAAGKLFYEASLKNYETFTLLQPAYERECIAKAHA